MAYKYFDKKSSGGAIKDKIFSNQRPLDLATQKLLENFKNETPAHLLKEIFGVLI